MTISMFGNLLGGLGLFLLGMHLMTEGLKIPAGKALYRILQKAFDLINSVQGL